MLACVCRPVTGTLPMPSPSSVPHKRLHNVVTCEPRIASTSSVTATNYFQNKVPGRPTAAELKAMALRQQQQIDSQHQLLAAKEQRLRFLKTQEAKGAAAAAEGERLRRLRERVEAQESKLRRLRALRGQVDLQKTYNVTLSNDLDSIRALFSEKEKELSLAVAKVEALTRQLEELRRDRRGPLNLISGSGTNSGVNGNEGTQQLATSPAARELEKLRRELMYRNQLSLQQDARLHLQREALQQRQAELRSVDQRIIELQTRLQRKKASNLLLTNIIENSNSRNGNNENNLTQQNRSGNVVSLPSQLPKLQPVNGGQVKKSTNVYPQQRVVSRSNVAAIEPYNHTPQKIIASSTNNTNATTISKSSTQLFQDLTNIKLNQQLNVNQTTIINHHNIQQQSHPESDENKLARQKLQNENNNDIVDNNNTSVDKLKDPKYQTLPYNTKYTNNTKTNECDSEKAGEIGMCVTGQLAHSIPLNTINKSIALIPSVKSNEDYDKNKPDIKPKLMLKHQIPSGNLVVPPRKPISTVVPTLAPKSNPKVHIVQPIAVNPNINSKEKDDSEPSSPRPALPPKPNKSQSNSQNSPNPEINSANQENVPTIVNLITKTNQNNLIESQTESSFPPLNSTLFNINNANLQDNLPIKARPLTIKKQPFHEQPKLRTFISGIKPIQYTSRRIEMPPSFLFPEIETVELKDNKTTDLQKSLDDPLLNGLEETSNKLDTQNIVPNDEGTEPTINYPYSIKKRPTSLTTNSENTKLKLSRRVSFDPLALLLDASLEGELELVKKTAMQVTNPSAANDEGITALHNAICAGHIEIVKFLVEFGCDVNAQDSDGWTPLHCAASCNNLTMVKFLVESGACLFAATLSDHETPAEKCEEDEEGFDGCSEYLYSIQEKLGILNNGEAFAVFAYDAQQPDELSFSINDRLTILRKGDDSEREWWWAKNTEHQEGYVPRNLFGLYPRIPLQNQSE